MESVSSTMRFSISLKRLWRWTACQVVLFAAVFSWFSFAQAKAERDKPGPGALTKEGRRWAEETLKGLSLEEKVGQMLQVRYYADYTDFKSNEYKYLSDEIQKYHIGSVVFGMHFNHLGPVKGSPLDAARVANQLQRDSKLSLLLAADIERGVASRLRDAPAFPWPMAFGAVGDEQEVERFGAITAREARAIGVQWALAPVADVNSNPANPVINDRSFGEDPEQVGALVVAFIKGARENGLLVTAKHFPGNGDTSTDSHRDVASVEGSLDHLQKVEFPPFKKAIDAGVDSILLAHARVPAIEPDPKKITTISDKVINGALRHDLGFRGVVLTDALEMQGLTKVYDLQKGSPTARAAMDAVKAGCDVIMIPTDLDGAFHGIVEAVQRGEISESRIDDSVRRILQMKALVGLDKSRFVDLNQVSALTGRPEDMEFAQHISDEAITLVRNDSELLPLQKATAPRPGIRTPAADPDTKHRLVVVVLGESLTSTDGQEFEKAIESRRSDAQVLYFHNRAGNAKGYEVLKAAKEAAQIVIVVYVVHSGVRQRMVDGNLMTSFGPLGPSGRLLQDLLKVAPKHTAVVALGSPYLIESFSQIQTYICTYAMATTSEISAVKALFGEIQNHAKLPVTLPGVATRGFSIPWPTTEHPTQQVEGTGK
jgi:beta-N-acetylhexosaminidase